MIQVGQCYPPEMQEEHAAFPKRSVPSGTFIVDGMRNEVLEAYLGSCLGVTLCDREAGVGGLVHLLLPEPAGLDSSWEPTAYATTAMPLFLKALVEAGASQERLRACMAGGALVGPISELDLNLNIGGRTEDIVEEFLNDRHIPLQKMETGGFFTCRLSLDLSTLESRIEPLEYSLSDMDMGSPRRLTPHDIESSLDRIRPIPQIALKITHMVREGKYSFQDVAKEIRQDQILSAKVIRLCRSALFAMKKEVDSIDRALVMLGEKRLLRLVVSASLEDFYPNSRNGYSLCKGGLYKHALGMALVCEAMADYTGKALSDVAYTAGLLHDIGKVVLDQHVARDLGLFYRRIQTQGENTTAAERELFGTTHTEVGGLLAKKWSLPEGLRDVILYHHTPEKAAVSPELVHLVYLADLIVSRFMAGNKMERLGAKDLRVRLNVLGLTASLLAVVEKLRASVEDQQVTNR